MDTRVLVVEDDAAHARLICANLASLARVEHVATQASALRAFERNTYDAVVLDVGLPDGDGFAIQRRLGSRQSAPPIVFVTSDDLAEHAMAALRAGAAHYVIKRPGYLDRVSEAVADALSRRRPAPSAMADALVGSSLIMVQVRQAIADYAKAAYPVLITGETGTGKDVAARCLHEQSALPGPFIAANCAAITTSLFESELFGSEQGAYTGAVRDRSGLVGAATGGSLFLDEVGDVPRSAQAKLLRFLETGRYRRVGSAVEATAKVRIIAATNRDLLSDSNDPFRQDLYYRLNVLRIDMPPLRARPGDIPELVDHFFRSNPNRSECSASADAVEELMRWRWPGNVRELKHCVERTIVRSSARQIESFDLGIDFVRSAPSGAGRITTARLVALLHRHSGRLGPVAEELAVSARTVQRHMTTAGLRLRDYRPRR